MNPDGAQATYGAKGSKGCQEEELLERLEEKDLKPRWTSKLSSIGNTIRIWNLLFQRIDSLRKRYHAYLFLAESSQRKGGGV
jgi:hypothetical protein